MHLKTLLKSLLVISLLSLPAVAQVTITPLNQLIGTIVSGAHSSTLYMALPGSTSNATEANVTTIAGIAGTVGNLTANTTVAPGGSDTIAVTIDKNSGAQSLTCTISASGTSCTDTTGAHAFTVAATDTLSVKLVFSTSVTSAIGVAVQLTSTATSAMTFNNHSLYGGSAPTISACGTSPTNTNATDNAGTVTLGSGGPTACTMTFATPFTNAPSCNVTTNSQATTPVILTNSTTVLTLGLLNTGATKVSYTCF